MAWAKAFAVEVMVTVKFLVLSRVYLWRKPD